MPESKNTEPEKSLGTLYHEKFMASPTIVADNNKPATGNQPLYEMASPGKKNPTKAQEQAPNPPPRPSLVTGAEANSIYEEPVPIAKEKTLYEEVEEENYEEPTPLQESELSDDERANLLRHSLRQEQTEENQALAMESFAKIMPQAEERGDRDHVINGLSDILKSKSPIQELQKVLNQDTLDKGLKEFLDKDKASKILIDATNEILKSRENESEKQKAIENLVENFAFLKSENKQNPAQECGLVLEALGNFAANNSKFSEIANTQSNLLTSDIQNSITNTLVENAAKVENRDENEVNSETATKNNAKDQEIEAGSETAANESETDKSKNVKIESGSPKKDKSKEYKVKNMVTNSALAVAICALAATCTPLVAGVVIVVISAYFGKKRQNTEDKIEKLEMEKADAFVERELKSITEEKLTAEAGRQGKDPGAALKAFNEHVNGGTQSNKTNIAQNESGAVANNKKENAAKPPQSNQENIASGNDENKLSTTTTETTQDSAQKENHVISAADNTMRDFGESIGDLEIQLTETQNNLNKTTQEYSKASSETQNAVQKDPKNTKNNWQERVGGSRKGGKETKVEEQQKQ